MKYLNINQRDSEQLIFSIVDDDDYVWARTLAWSLDSKGYAKHLFIPEMKMRKLHRMIMNAPDGVQVDHINGDKLDNRKSNLRLCSNAQNQRNRPIQKNNTSGYKGVVWMSDRNKWRAQVFLDGKNHIVGCFDSPRDAAIAYNQKALELHGEFAKLNVIED